MATLKKLDDDIWWTNRGGYASVYSVVTNLDRGDDEVDNGKILEI